MGDSVEKEEVGGLNRHDEHDPTCDYDCEERDDVEDSKDVQDDVAWSALGLGVDVEVEHCVSWIGRLMKLRSVRL